MKIEADLRIAITAAAKGQPLVKQRLSYDERNKEQQHALAAFRKKKPELERAYKALAKHEAEINRLRKEVEKHEATLGKFGISNQNRHPISEPDVFRKAGGILKEEISPWKAEACIARLLEAKDQKTFDAILKEYGINWS